MCGLITTARKESISVIQCYAARQRNKIEVLSKANIAIFNKGRGDVSDGNEQQKEGYSRQIFCFGWGLRVKTLILGYIFQGSGGVHKTLLFYLILRYGSCSKLQWASSLIVQNLNEPKTLFFFLLEFILSLKILIIAVCWLVWKYHIIISKYWIFVIFIKISWYLQILPYILLYWKYLLILVVHIFDALFYLKVIKL